MRHVRVHVLEIQGFKLPTTAANVTVVVEVNGTRLETPAASVDSASLSSGRVHIDTDEPLVFTVDEAAASNSEMAVKVYVKCQPPHSVLGSGAAIVPLSVPTGGLGTMTITTCSSTNGLVPTGSVILGVGVEDATTARRPNLPEAPSANVAKWSGTLRMRVMAVGGVPIQVAPGAHPTGYVKVLFAHHTQQTTQRPWQREGTSDGSVGRETYSCCWDDDEALVFDMVQHQSRQIHFVLHGAVESDDVELARGGLYLPTPHQRSLHAATQTISLGDTGATLTVHCEQSYHQPMREGMHGRPKSAYYNREGTAKMSSWDSDDESVHNTPQLKPLPAPRQPGSRPTSAQRLRSFVETERDDVASLQNEVAALRLQVHEQSTAMQRMAHAMESMYATIQQQQETLEAMQRSHIRPMELRIDHIESAVVRKDGAVYPQQKQRPFSAAARSLAVHSPLEGFTEDQMRRKFSEYDVSGTGYITKSQLRDFYMSFDSLGMLEDARSVDKVISRYVKGNGNLVSFDEFAQLTLHLAQR